MRKAKSKESGEVMLEGMIVMIITMLMLVWILGVGFLYYQKYTVRIATNDAATKVASTYNAPTTDLVMGFISTKDLADRALYSSPDLTGVNQDRAYSYVNYSLNLANFTGTVDDVNVTMNRFEDGMGRSHICVKTECSFNTPFGQALDFFGMSGKVKYATTAYAESTDLSDYISSVALADALTNGSLLKGTGIVEQTVKMINSFISACNHIFS